MNDDAFSFSRQGLTLALELLERRPGDHPSALPEQLPFHGIGEAETLRLLAPRLLGGARDLGADSSFAHMDPPTPWITWAVTQWNAALNQNLLHADTAPAAIDIERRVVDWLAPVFGMNGGHMTPGATVANLTAIWAARETVGARRVLASEAAHLSVAKAAHILGLDFDTVPVDSHGRMRTEQLPATLHDTCLVLTAGTTGAGAIDPLGQIGGAAWVHVDAAWGGALQLSDTYAARLAGIQAADSVCLSAHKWLFQPKESAIVFFRDTETANAGIQFDGAYLAAANIGVLGSHGAMAAPLLATLLAWGRQGMATRIEQCMDAADALYAFIEQRPELDAYATPSSGIVVWRAGSQSETDRLFDRLTDGSTSRTRINGFNWLRNVAANPQADIDALTHAIASALAASD